ncbi:CBS domain-containing protein [Magnetospirillum sp. 15-1]|uniref:CBS domain-containing protein n=1 Tax=Magnetospirillum sp. 15-1 TaxID=1979370 RepID=UPI000BBC9F3F|nr:CBS domain-containing protein [Magnetospirillum sp. 15-1]
MIVKSILDGKAGRGNHLTVQPNEFASTVARILTTAKIGAVAVLDTDGRIAGIASERDIVRGLAQHGQAISCLSVAEIMTTEVLVCHETDHVNRLIKSMTERRIRHVPVVDESHRMVGMLTIGDIIKSMLFDELPNETAALCEYRRHGIN